MKNRSIIIIAGISFLLSGIFNFSIFIPDISTNTILYLIVYSLPQFFMAILLLFNIKNIIKLNDKDVTLALPYIIFIIIYVISRITNGIHIQINNLSSLFNLYNLYYLLYHILFIIAVVINTKVPNRKINVLYILSAIIILIYTIFSNRIYPYLPEIASNLAESVGIILIGISEYSAYNNELSPAYFNIRKSKNDTNSEIEKLIKYKNLLDKGLITKSEFNNLKKKIFNKETSYEN